MRACWAVIVVLGFTRIGSQAQQAVGINKDVLNKAIDEYALASCPALLRDRRARERLTSDVEDLAVYLNSSMINLMIDRPKFCEMNVPTIKRKYAITVNDLTPCFKNDTKYMGEFAKGMFDGLLDFMCNNDARNIDELLSYGAQSCARNIQVKGKLPELKKCLMRLKGSGEPMKKPMDELCRDLGVIETCIGEVLDKYCSHWEHRRRINRELFEGIMRPCPGSASISSFSAFLFIITMIHNLLF